MLRHPERQRGIFSNVLVALVKRVPQWPKLTIHADERRAENNAQMNGEQIDQKLWFVAVICGRQAFCALFSARRSSAPIISCPNRTVTDHPTRYTDAQLRIPRRRSR